MSLLETCILQKAFFLTHLIHFLVNPLNVRREKMVSLLKTCILQKAFFDSPNTFPSKPSQCEKGENGVST